MMKDKNAIQTNLNFKNLDRHKAFHCTLLKCYKEKFDAF
jgi:hypothetical protein